MYLNLIQLAESFGVSERVIDDWIRNEGLPHTDDRGRILFDRAEVAQWAAGRGLATRAGFLAPDATTRQGDVRIADLLRAGRIWRDVSAADVPATFSRIVESLPGTTPPIRKMLAQRVCTRGGVTIAPVGMGFALPHPSARIALGRDAGTVALILLRDPLVFEEPAVDDTPVTRLFFFIAPSPRAHLDLLGRLGRLLARATWRDQVANLPSDAEILRITGVEESALAGRAGGGETPV